MPFFVPYDAVKTPLSVKSLTFQTLKSFNNLMTIDDN
jgi:hypothetical protein